ncbi:hypothetical protein ACKUTN_33050 [Klebsiella michiganensis]
MNRKQFIQSRGANCRNWTWSWSFINHDDQLVIFGAWDVERDQERAVILREEWEYNARLRKNPGYTQAVEHIGYILGGYDLYTFNMVQATSPDAPDVAVIQDFERRLEKRFLRKRAPSGTPTSRPVRTLRNCPLPAVTVRVLQKPSPLMHTNATRPPGGPVLHIMVLSVSAADSILRKPGASTGKDSSTFIISGR